MPGSIERWWAVKELNLALVPQGDPGLQPGAFPSMLTAHLGTPSRSRTYNFTDFEPAAYAIPP